MKRTVYRSEQEPTWQVPLWTLVQDPHTDALAFRKEAAGKKNNNNNNTEYLKLVPT